MNLNRVRRRDWFAILRSLMRAGVSMRKIASKCGRNEYTVRGWANDGADPKDTDARIVLALYAKHCPAEYAAHEREFGIRADINAVTDIGDTLALPFVGG